MVLLRKAASKIAHGILKPMLQKCGCGYLSSVGLEHIDLQLVAILGQKRHGTFIEAGANDGIAQSNTYYLEKVLGWHGVLVEPLPSKAKSCKRNRPGSKVVNAALVNSQYRKNTVTIHPANLMSVVADGSNNQTWIDKHTKLGCENQGLSAERPFEVPAFTLCEILRQQGLSSIDFFSLDVEGYELNVLQGLDFGQVKIEWLFVETRPENEREIDELLSAQGFQWERSWVTTDYANKLYRHLDFRS